jgi:tRNA G26 N,N-dimethylase Trm1
VSVNLAVFFLRHIMNYLKEKRSNSQRKITPTLPLKMSHFYRLSFKNQQTF